MSLFKSLKALLVVKSRTAKDGGANDLVGYQDTNAQGFDRFVVRDWYEKNIKTDMLFIYYKIYIIQNQFISFKVCTDFKLPLFN